MVGPDELGKYKKVRDFCLEFQSMLGHAIWKLKDEFSVVPSTEHMNRLFSSVTDAGFFPCLGQVE